MVTPIEKNYIISVDFCDEGNIKKQKHIWSGYTRESKALEKYHAVVDKYAADKKVFEGDIYDSLSVNIKTVVYNNKGSIETEKLVDTRTIYNPSFADMRRIICVIRVDDTTAESLGIGPLDYLEQLLEPIGHIEFTHSMVLDDDDPEDAANLGAVENIFGEGV